MNSFITVAPEFKVYKLINSKIFICTECLIKCIFRLENKVKIESILIKILKREGIKFQNIVT